jgi:hypothetical protein
MSKKKKKKKLHKLDKTEIQNIKMGEEVARVAKHAMHIEMKRILGDHEKDMKEHMAKQSLKHAVELNELNKSQMAIYNLFAKKSTPLVH